MYYLTNNTAKNIHRILICTKEKTNGAENRENARTSFRGKGIHRKFREYYVRNIISVSMYLIPKLLYAYLYLLENQFRTIRVIIHDPIMTSLLRNTINTKHVLSLCYLNEKLSTTKTYGRFEWVQTTSIIYVRVLY